MPKLSCEPQVYRPGTRRSIRRGNPYHNKKNVANKEDIRENVSTQKRIDPTLCLICKAKINVEARRFLQDIQYHYTLCLFREGRFREIVTPMNDDENKRQYICLRQGCSMREMKYREYCIHEGIAHSATKKLMASDSRPGLKNILSGLFPKKENTAKEKVQRDIAKITVEPNKNVPNINIRKDSPKFDMKKSSVRSDFSRMEEEEVDDPSNIINEVENEAKQPMDCDYSDDPDTDEDLICPDLTKPRNCFICDGRESKDARNLNLGTKLSELKYHIAKCYYEEGKLSHIDAGPLNRNSDGSPVDEKGTMFKYRCPFNTCAQNNATRGGKKTVGYKEYALHLAKDHHQLEVVLARDRRPEAAEVRAALIQARKREGGLLERVPEVQVEEVHVCLVCNGENKEGKNLSFDRSKVSSLRYHYAQCLYDTGVYLEPRYSENFQLDKHEDHEKNIGEDGKPNDVLGTIYRYTCRQKKCSSRRKMGFKEYCIHTAADHGIVINIMLKSENEDLKKLGIRLKEIFG